MKNFVEPEIFVVDVITEDTTSGLGGITGNDSGVLNGE